MSLLKSHGWTKAVCTFGMVLGLCANSWSVEFAGGTGEPNDPYQIATANQLVSIGSDPNLLDKHFALVASIDLDPCLPGGRVFTQAVITPDTDPTVWGFQGLPFSGTFDGQGHRTRRLRIDGASGSPGGEQRRSFGLFGDIESGAVVINVNIVDADIIDNGSVHVGILAGRNRGNIDHCSVSGFVSSDGLVGGMIGRNDGDVRRCVSMSTIVGSAWLGGLAGYSTGYLRDCTSTGTTTGSQFVGGLVGENHGTISCCRSCGSTSGKERAGGSWRSTAARWTIAGTLAWCRENNPIPVG